MIWHTFNKAALSLFAGSLLLTGSFATQQAQAKEFIAIGTGGPTGVYFILGNAICRMVNKHASKSKELRCSAPSSGGSVYNINSIKSGDFNLGVAQSDIQFQAFKGKGQYAGKQFSKLRSLFSVHPEPFQILTGKGTNIKSWADLKGKRVNIGNPGSGQRATFEALMSTADVDASYFKSVTELNSTEQSSALCDGKIDAYGYTVGVPNAGVAQAADGCGASIINLDTAEAEKLVRNYPYFTFSTIPRGTYSTTKADVKTFGVMATIVSSTDMSNDTAYQIVKAVFENIDQFKKMHPAFANLDPKDMIKNGLSAPLHDGAVKYFREKGLM